MEKRRASMSQEPPETPQEISLSPYNETEMSISDIPLPPAKRIRTSISQQPRETTRDSSLFPSKKETELTLFGFPMNPPGYNNQAIMRQEPRETTDQDSSISPSMETGLLLFGVSMTPVENSQEPLTDVPMSPAKSLSSKPRHIPNEYLFLPPKELEIGMSLSSASPMDTDEDLMMKNKTNCLDEDPLNGIVSTAFCLHDETWPCGNREYPKVTCVPREDETTEQEEPRNVKELSKEQEEPEERDPWVIKKKLSKIDVCNRVNLSVYGVERHILRHLFKYEQKRVLEGDGIMVNVYDDDTHTSHKLRLRKWSFNETCCLTDRWRTDFVNRRSLKVGDEIGLFWDRFHSTLHFRVVSSAIPKASAEEKK
ncbi:unnamed protein product [Microthlaspi erraticum]|uniref:TF-B3 domain-containing protein n=1 Tax=Microthlaspi erraticum TaxID=1685480 RepID=A0A6D2JAI9_9BRAS|nr:unnamed protein product [Microthlaspi erraticum]